MEPNNCLSIFLSSIPLLSPKNVLRGCYFPRHTSKQPWPSSPGHCLTSGICPGPIRVQPKFRHINLSQQDVDRSAPVKGAGGVVKRESCYLLGICPLNRDLINECISQVTLCLTKISPIKQNFWVGC